MAEKQGSFIVLLISMALVIMAILFFFFLKSSFYKGMAIPLLLFGVIAGTGSYVVYNRSDGDRIRNVYAYDMNPAQLKNQELPRMKKVMMNFITLRYIEIAFILLGAGLFIYPMVARISNKAGWVFWKGFGLTLAIFGLIGLTVDHFAEKRGHIYTDGLESYVSKK